MELMQRRRELMTFEHEHWATAMGSIATFNTPFAKPLRLLKAEFMPVQEGTDDPSPDNVRPITGWTGVNVERRGKNLFDAEKIVSDSNNVHTYIADGFLRFSTGSIRLAWNDINLPCPLRFSGRAKNFSIDGITTLALNLYFSNGGTSMVYIKSQMPANSAADFSVTIGHSGDVLSSIKSTWTSSREAGFDLSVTQLELGLTATTYEPFNGTTLPIDWSSDGTVYGGYVDLVTGELVETWHSVDMGRLDYTYRSNLGGGAFSGTMDEAHGAPKPQNSWVGICSKYPYLGSYNALVGKSQGIGYVYSNDVIVKDTSVTLDDPAVMKASLSGTILCYPLATPIVHQLTPQQISALVGTNNIWSTANGNVTAEYWTR